MNNFGVEGKLRFSIRKLTIGTTSVILGSLLWLNVSARPVHADVLPGEQTIAEQVSNTEDKNRGQRPDDSTFVADKKNTDQDGGKVNSSANAQPADNSAATADNNIGNKSNMVSSAEKEDGPAESKAKPSRQSGKTKDLEPKEDSLIITKQDKQQGDKNKLAQELGTAELRATNPNGPKTITDERDGKRIQISVEHRRFDPYYDDSQNITLQMGGESGKLLLKKGTVITLTMSPGMYYYSQDPYNNNNYFDFDKDQYVIHYVVDHDIDGSGLDSGLFAFRKSFTFNAWGGEQDYNLSNYRYQNDRRHQSQNDWRKDKLVTVSFSSGEKYTLSFTQRDMEYMTPTIKLASSDYFNPQVKVNTDYTWEIDTREQSHMYGNDGANSRFDDNLTENATIDVTVPDSFKLNEDQTKALYGANDGISVSQVGNHVFFFITKGTANYAAYPSGYRFVGGFYQDKPERDQTITFPSVKLQQKFVQRVTALVNGFPQVTDELSGKTSWQGTLIGKKDASGQPHHLPAPRFYDLSGSIYGNNTKNELTKGGVGIALNHMTFTNTNSQALHDINFKITIPDGFAAQSLYLPAANISAAYTYQIKYWDSNQGRLVLEKSGSANAADGQNWVLALTTREIDLHFDTIPGNMQWGVYQGPDGVYYPKFSGISLIGHIADRYRNGQDVKTGDVFTTKMIVSNGTDPDEYLNCINQQTLVGKVHDQLPLPVDLYPEQDTTEPGIKDAGKVVVDVQANDNDKFKIYFVVPENAVYDPQTYDHAEAVTHLEDGRTVVVYNQDSYHTFGDEYVIHYGNKWVKRSSSEYVEVYVWSENGKKIVSNIFSNTDQTTFAGHNVYRLQPAHDWGHSHYHTDWEVLVSQIESNFGQAQGNKDNAPTAQGTADINGDSTLHFFTNYENGLGADLINFDSVTNLPLAGIDSSTFTFNLKDANSVEVLDSDGHVIRGAQIKYLLGHQADLTANNGQVDTSLFVNANAVSDWSQVRAVYIHINKILQGQKLQIAISGQDPNFKQDSGKVAYLSSSSWADNALALTILPAQDYSAKLSLIGKAHNPQPGPNQPSGPQPTLPEPTVPTTPTMPQPTKPEQPTSPQNGTTPPVHADKVNPPRQQQKLGRPSLVKEKTNEQKTITPLSNHFHSGTTKQLVSLNKKVKYQLNKQKAKDKLPQTGSQQTLTWLTSLFGLSLVALAVWLMTDKHRQDK